MAYFLSQGKSASDLPSLPKVPYESPRSTMREIDGVVSGLKANHIKRLSAMLRKKIKGNSVVSPDLARYLADLSHELHRQIGVLVARGGDVERVIVGEATRLYLPDIGRTRVSPNRLRGLRLIRTDLRPQGLTREDLADLSKLRLDAVVAIQVDGVGQPKKVEWAYLVPDAISRTVSPTIARAAHVQALPDDGMLLVRDAEIELSRLFSGEAREVGRAAALLVGVWPAQKRAKILAEESMEELAQLASTADVRVVGRILQIRRELDPRTVVGKGKIEELALRALELGADVLIFDRDLTPSQLRAITDTTDLRVLDRTQLILDIFARRAKSRDGKLQVELAQLKYTLPRLIEKSTALSRLTGGIGGQGPGETKLEIHRRRAKDRIHRLEKEIAQLSVQRGIRRARREAARVPTAAIVGYTNAGKSTLLNTITHASVMAEDKLFATLDPTSRRVRFPNDLEIVLTDTVGFIRDLPKDLVNAFKATLEELESADVIVHVVDASDPNVVAKMAAVDKIMRELRIERIPRIVAVNKIDLAPKVLVAALRRSTGGVAISAKTKEGLAALVEEIARLVVHPVTEAVAATPLLT